MRINNEKQNFKNLSVLKAPLGAFYNANATLPTLIIETGVTTGRAFEANKRGGKKEASERLIEQGISAIVWIYGVQALKNIGEFVGKNILKIDDLNFDVGFDKLRNPIKNNNISKKAMGFKAGNILFSTALATFFIGFILPKINHKISSKFNKKEETAKETTFLKPNFEEFKNNTRRKEISFTSLIDNSIKLAHTLENNSAARLLITDTGVISGRFHNSRNKYEKIESLFRDISSIYFYLFSTPHITKLLNKFSKNTDINPKVLEKTVEMLEKNLKNEDKKTFLNNALGTISNEEIKKLEELFKDKEVIELKDFTEIFKDKKNKAFEMTKLQPFFETKPQLTKQQAKDVLIDAWTTKPEFLKETFDYATNGASSNKLKFVSKKELEKMRTSIDNFIYQIIKKADKEKAEINIDFVKKIANNNIRKNFAFNSIATVISMFALGILIPKVQYWITKKLTNENRFPGEENYPKS